MRAQHVVSYVISELQICDVCGPVTCNVDLDCLTFYAFHVKLVLCGHDSVTCLFLFLFNQTETFTFDVNITCDIFYRTCGIGVKHILRAVFNMWHLLLSVLVCHI